MSKDSFTPASDRTYVVPVPLARPVKSGDAVYNTLTMREPTIGDQLDAIRPGMGQGEGEMALVAHLCGVPFAVIRRVSLVDYRVLQGHLANFPYSTAVICDAPSPPSPA